jgi:hypothetical protein
MAFHHSNFLEDFPLVVSYYTKDTLYQLEVQNLIASCEQWQLEYHVESITSFGSWERNCSYKPFFLLEKLQQFGKPILWIDADGVFIKKPQRLAVFASDLAVRINQNYDDSHPSKVLSGTVYVNATVGAERVLKSWAKECLDTLSNPQRTEEFWDQAALRDVIRRRVPGARISALPAGYVTIVDNPQDEKEIDDVVIRHYQASRRFKKIINEKA